MKEASRRNFLKTVSLGASFAGLQSIVGTASADSKALTKDASKMVTATGYGPLKEGDSRLRLPEGFSYVTMSKKGELMDDGFHVPGAHDGMAAFAGPDGSTVLIRNHEVKDGDIHNGPFKGKNELTGKLEASDFYDTAHGKHNCVGGTTTLVYDTREQKLLKHFLSLTGTVRNCSGGPTPWGSWITCEEVLLSKGSKFEHDHGYNFEVPANSEIGLATPVALKEMGRFNHEAVAVDPASGIVYQTEDRPDGLIYRYIPNVRGQLSKGGKLQALAIKDPAFKDTRNWSGSSFPTQKELEVEWIDMDNVESPKDDLRDRGSKAGAAVFARGEGMIYGNGEVYFACTNGGPKKFGQIFRYKPSRYEGQEREKTSPGVLELFIESYDHELMKSCDNLTIAPWGDVVICEDDGRDSAIVGITQEGKIYHIAHVAVASELAGCCFSPDGTTLFVNIQWYPGETLAITGPWLDRKD